MQWSRSFEESLGTHDPLKLLALDHDLAPPSPNDYSLPPLDVQTMNESYDDMKSLYEFPIAIPWLHDLPIPCVDVPLICEALVEVRCVLCIVEPLPYVYDHLSCEPFDLEVNVSIVKEP